MAAAPAQSFSESCLSDFLVFELPVLGKLGAAACWMPWREHVLVKPCSKDCGVHAAPPAQGTLREELTYALLKRAGAPSIVRPAPYDCAKIPPGNQIRLRKKT